MKMNQQMQIFKKISLKCVHTDHTAVPLTVTDGDPSFAPATVAPAMISWATKNYCEGNDWVLVRVRVRIKIRTRVRFKVRVGATFNISVYHWSKCHTF